MRDVSDFQSDEIESDPRVGTLLGERYRIDVMIGEGGMGRIYAAEHVLMKKKVAVKVLHRRLTSVPDVVARFEREAMAAANIDNPHVAGATDFGKLPDGAVFLVLEYIDGVGLRDAMDQGPMPPARALHIARQLTAALASAHALGIVHRDLKPENVMLVQKGNDPDFVKVLDFGIARVPIGDITGREPRRPSEGPITRAGTVFGTPEYMPPEQALGQSVDGRADLYSLGVILFEMIAGVRPYVAGTQTGLLGQQLVGLAPRISARAPDVTVSAEVETIVQRLLERETTDRFQSAEEVIQILSAVMGVPMPPESQVTPAPSSVAPRPLGGVRPYDTEIKPLSIPASVPPAEAMAGGPSTSWHVVRWGTRNRILRWAPWALGALLLLAFGAIIARLDETPSKPVDVDARRPTPKLPSPTHPGAATGQAPAGVSAAPNTTALDHREFPPLPKDPSTLEKLFQDHPDHADAATELARVYTEGRNYPKAAERVAQALKNDPRFNTDGRIASVLFQTVQSKAAREASFTLLEGPMGSRGADILYDLAVDDRILSAVRQRADLFLKSKACRNVASPALAIAVALRSTKACQERRALLPRANEVGDGRSLVYLRGYLERTGCGRAENEDCSACLRKDSALDDAIDAIKQRSQG